MVNMNKNIHAQDFVKECYKRQRKIVIKYK